MDRRIDTKPARLAALGALLTLATGCQDLNSLVTGQKFLVAPKGSPRVEVEVDFVVHDSFYAALDGVDRTALEADMEDLVLGLADLGLRFYPVPADAYESGDARPERHMLVELSELSIAVDEKTVEEEGQPMRIVANVSGVTCAVVARVEKRRSGAPALVVGQGEANGKVRPGPATAEELAAVSTYGVHTEVAAHEGLRVEEQDLLDAFEEGLVDALRSVVKAVDRDLAAEGAH